MTIDNDYPNNSWSNSLPQQHSILVGYAFGSKKMNTMGAVMAEASKTKVATMTNNDYPNTDHQKINKDNQTIIRNIVSDDHNHNNISHDNNNNDNNKKNKERPTCFLTNMILQDQEASSNVFFSISGGPSGAGLGNIVRNLRQDDETASTTKTSSTISSSWHPIPIRVSFVPLDLDSPLEEQHGGHFDVILHKMTEDCLVLNQIDDTYKTLIQETTTEHELHDAVSKLAPELQISLQRMHRLVHYQQNHARCALIDHPSHVQVVMSRWQIATILQTALNDVCSTSGIPCQTPRFVTFQGGTLKTAVSTVSTTTLSAMPPLKYPLIAKPLTAAGTKKSHCMGVVLHQAGLTHIETPCLLQEYANHNSILYKVYVLGETVHVFSRPSLPDLPIHSHELNRLDSYVEFDSQRPYPTLADFGLSISPQECQPKEWLEVEELTPIVASLRRAFGLDLFGFDILHTGTVLLVVDVNYFPSYKEVSHFPQLLATYLMHRAMQNR
jgi:inositol-1,3,4-trisphosphate 5/6-kinase / inositol-tetrakisphosphate 1-kinase